MADAKVSVGSVPAEAQSKGEINAQGLTVSDRDPIGNCPKTEGPVKHPETEAFMPAEYTTAPGIIRRDR